MTTSDMLGKPEPGSRWRRAEENKDMMLNSEERRELLRAIHADRRERIERSVGSTRCPLLPENSEQMSGYGALEVYH